MGTPKWAKEFERQGANRLPKAEQLAWLEAYANSLEHFEYTPTTYYGDHDPLDVTISACSNCHTTQQKLWRPKFRRGEWRVVCTCGAEGSEHQYPRQAIFHWNLSSKSMPYVYKTAPLFQLHLFDPIEAHERLTRIQNDLSLKIAIGTLRKSLKENVSDGYLTKLTAYLDWTRFLIDVIENQRRNGDSESNPQEKHEKI